jgi:hypothetical protein
MVEEAGGAWIAQVLASYWDAVEADLQRFYGINTAQACWGVDEVGARRLLVLIRGLPYESALARAVRRRRR